MDDILKSSQPFEEYLKDIHAKNYMGTDDNMADSFEKFITEIEPEDLIKHGNVLSRLLIDSFVVKVGENKDENNNKE